MRRPTDVIFVCPDAETAEFYSQPHRTGLPGYVFPPRALYPSQIPVMADPKEVADEGIAEGVAKGEREAVLLVLEARGLKVKVDDLFD